MALNIPMPEAPGSSLLKGLHAGGSLYSQIMAPKIQRENMQRQWQQHLDQLQLQKAAAGRASQARDEAHQLFMMKKDPLYAIKQMEAMQNYMNRGQGQNQGAMPSQEQSYMPGIGGMFGQQQPQQQPPQDYSALEQMITGGQQQEPGQGQFPALEQMITQGGAPQQEEVPALNEQAVSPFEAASAPQPHHGLDLEDIKRDPMKRAMWKKLTGVDLTAQTPEEKLQEKIKLHAANRQFDIEHPTKTIETPEQKDARAIELFRKKQAIKNSPGENIPLTTGMKSKLQGAVIGVDNALPVLKDLITDFEKLPTGAESLHPSAYAAYNAKANAIIEPLINAFGLNVTDATKAMMHDQVFRKTNEPVKKYRDRLVDLSKEILRRRNDSYDTLKTGAVNTKSNFTPEFFENLKHETKIINGKIFYKIDGEWHE